MAYTRIRRRELWRYPGHVQFLVPILLAVAFFATAGWRYADRTDFARRAVVTTAKVEEIQRSAPTRRDDGISYVSEFAWVRYTVGQQSVRARTFLRSCRPGLCSPSPPKGESLPIAYDRDEVTHAILAPGNRVPQSVDQFVYWLGACGLVTLGCAAAILYIGR